MGVNDSNLYSAYRGFFNSAYPVTVPISTQISSTIKTGGMCLVGIQLPAALTSTALTFLASTTGAGGSFQPVVNASGAVSYTVAQGQYVAIDPKDFQGIAYLQIKCGTSEAAARTLVCSLKGL